jgi:ketosteroid isomerase-like protein
VGTTGRRDAAAAPAEASVEREILRAAQQWFEAYFAGDAPGMKHIESADFALVDDRAADRRLAATMPGVERGLQQVQIDVAGEGAVMSARLVERAQIDGQPREYVSLVSGVWLRTGNSWRLTGLRFIDPASVSPPY